MSAGVGVVGSMLSPRPCANCGVASSDLADSSSSTLVVVGSIVSVVYSFLSVTPSTTNGPVVVSSSSKDSEVVVSCSEFMVSSGVVVSLDMDEYSKRLLSTFLGFFSCGAFVASISGIFFDGDGRIEFFGRPLTGTPEDLMFEYTSVRVEIDDVPSKLKVVK